MEEIREAIPVLYLETTHMLEGIKPLFDRLYAAFDRLEQRVFYGVSTGPNGTYRACVEKLESDDANALALREWELPGGLFAVERVDNWSSDPGRIAAAFQRKLTDYAGRIDDWGWGIEEYLADDAVDVMIKINP